MAEHVFVNAEQREVQLLMDQLGRCADCGRQLGVVVQTPESPTGWRLDWPREHHGDVCVTTWHGPERVICVPCAETHGG